jgi:hypothetical protein
MKKSINNNGTHFLKPKNVRKFQETLSLTASCPSQIWQQKIMWPNFHIFLYSHVVITGVSKSVADVQ